jgi:hypothetical protein
MLHDAKITLETIRYASALNAMNPTKPRVAIFKDLRVIICLFLIISKSNQYW